MAETALKVIDSDDVTNRIELLYEQLIIGEERFSYLDRQREIICDYYRQALSYALRSPEKVPEFYDILMMVSEHNNDTLLEIEWASLTSNPEQMEEIRANLPVGYTPEQFDEALQEAVIDSVEAGIYNMSYYFGPNKLEDFILETLQLNSMTVKLGEECLTMGGTIYKHFDVILCDAQNVIVPSFQIAGFDDAIGESLDQNFTRNLIAFPKPIDEVHLIPEFASHKVR